MPHYRYIARDRSGADASGEIEAADAVAARAALESRGIDGQGLTLSLLDPPKPAPNDGPTNAAPSIGSLSAGDALQLTGHLADLSKAGVPLAAGLQALGRDLPRGRLATSLQRLAGHLERGVLLNEAASMPDVRLPAHVRSLIACGMQAGHLPEVLERFLEHQQMTSELRRRLWSVMAYPALLTTLLAGWFGFMLYYVLPGYVRTYHEFEITLPVNTQLLILLSEQGWGAVALAVCLVAAIAFLWLGIRIPGVANAAASVPFFGPLRRDVNLAEAFSLLGLFTEYGVPLPAALELSASVNRDGAVAAGLRDAAAAATRGQFLSDCLTQSPPFPPSLRPIVAWGDWHSAPAEALGSAAELLRMRVEQRAQVIALVMPPIMFVVMTIAIMFVVQGMLSPLFRLIRSLSM